MEFYPNSKAPGEYLYCDQDGNKKHIIKVDADWNDIIGKPEHFENAVYAILGMILDSASYGEFRDVDSIGRVKQYLNEVILKNLTTNFEIDTTKAIAVINRYLESIKYGSQP